MAFLVTTTSRPPPPQISSSRDRASLLQVSRAKLLPLRRLLRQSQKSRKSNYSRVLVELVSKGSPKTSPFQVRQRSDTPFRTYNEGTLVPPVWIPPPSPFIVSPILPGRENSLTFDFSGFGGGGGAGAGAWLGRPGEDWPDLGKTRFAAVAAAMHEKLAAVDTSRSYTLTQTLLPGTTPLGGDQPPPLKRRALDMAAAAGPSRQTKKPYENNTVRVDHRDQKITSMLQPVGRDSGSSATGDADATKYEYDSTREWYKIPYTNINILRDQVREAAHEGLAELFLNHTFVGLVDPERRLAAVQHGVKLYLVDYAAVCYEMFYQIALSDFNNIGRIRLNPPLPVRDLLQIAADEEKELEKAERPKQTADGGEGEGDDEPDGDAVMHDDGAVGFDWEGATKV